MIKSKFSSVYFKPLKICLFWSPSQNAYEDTSLWFNNEIGKRGKILYDVKFSDEIIEQNPELFNAKYAYLTIPKREYKDKTYYWVKVNNKTDYEPAQYISGTNCFYFAGIENGWSPESLFEIRNEVK